LNANEDSTSFLEGIGVSLLPESSKIIFTHYFEGESPVFLSSLNYFSEIVGLGGNSA